MDWEEKKRRFIEAVKMGLTIRYSQDSGDNYFHALGHLETAYSVLNNLPSDERSPEALAEQFLRYHSRDSSGDDHEEWMV